MTQLDYTDAWQGAYKLERFGHRRCAAESQKQLKKRETIWSPAFTEGEYENHRT